MHHYADKDLPLTLKSILRLQLLKCTGYFIKKEMSAPHFLRQWGSSDNPDGNTSARPTVSRNVYIK